MKKDQKKLEAQIAALKRRVKELERRQWMDRFCAALRARLASGI